mmetsp:Transcript_19321/g.53856  ORF Transcript_19321/g.53856 Transcript_19321/m.53856 type:complete len:150 (+) Transcript_19321:420-869(+)
MNITTTTSTTTTTTTTSTSTTTVASAMEWASASSVSPREQIHHKKPRRGRSLTARDPRECTNAACNLGKRMDTLPRGRRRHERHHHHHHHRRHHDRQQQHHSLVTGTIDRFAIFGDSTLALMVSYLLLTVAVGLSLALEPVEPGERRFQ